MPLPLTDGTSTISGVQRDEGADAGRDRATAATRRPPGTLDLSISRRGAVRELGLSGDLDMATAPRLGEAIARRRDGERQRSQWSDAPSQPGVQRQLPAHDEPVPDCADHRRRSKPKRSHGHH